MINRDGQKFTIIKPDSGKYIDECLAIGRELKEYFTEEAIIQLSNDLLRHSLYVVKNFNDVVGFATTHKRSSDVAEISFMAVKQEHQRQGIGSALVDCATNDLKSEGVKLVEIKTLSEDVDYFPYEKTRRFWKKKGFIHLDTIDPFPGWEPGSPCAIYVKIL